MFRTRRLDRRALLKGAGALAASGSCSASASLLPGPALAQPAGAPIMRAIPKTGEMIPAIGLGTFETFDITPGEPRDHVRDVIRTFHEAGGG